MDCPALGEDCPGEWLQWAGRCKCWTWSCLEQKAGGHWDGEGGWAEEVRTSGEKVRSGGDERDLGDQSFLKTQIGKHILYLNIIVSKCYRKALQILQIAFTYFYISRLTVISVVVKK